MSLWRLALRTAAGPLRPAWTAAYAIAARGAAAWLRGGSRSSSVYVRASVGEADFAPGVSDIDLVVVAAAERDVHRVRARRRRLSRLHALLGRLFEITVLTELPERPAAVYGLADAPDARDTSAYFGPHALPDQNVLIEQVPIGGPMRDWRRLAGPERRGAAAPVPDDLRHLVAWSHLQRWWAYAGEVSAEPVRPHSAWLCAKLIAEPLRVYLWLVHAETPPSRVLALQRARVVLEAEEPAIAAALAVLARPGTTAPPLGVAVAALHRVTARIAQFLATEMDSRGTTAVTLDHADADALLLAPGAMAGVRALGADRVLPLVDWRALVVAPYTLDESFAVVPGDAADATRLAQVARTAGTYPGLLGSGLLVFASTKPTTRGVYRSVYCRLSNPVSFGLLDDGPAHFPNVPGWSVQDTARRAVAEHRAMLHDPRFRADDAVTTLARLFSAARAALLHAGVADGAPVLTPTVTATARRLSEHSPAHRDAIELALGAYRATRREGAPVDPSATRGLRAAIAGLDAYR